MRTLRKISLALATVLLALPAMASDDDKVNAAQLIGKAQQGLAFVVAAGRANPDLSSDETKAKPFWNGLKDLGENLTNAKAQLEAKDDKFFTSLASANAAYVQARIATIMIAGTDQRLSSGMDSLGRVLETIMENYSKEAQRLKQGGELTAAEKAQLDKLIAQQDELIKKLEEVEKNVARNNVEMQKSIAAIKEESRKLRRSRSNVGGFVGGFFAAHFIYDWLWGWHWWWGPWGGWCPGYIDIGIIVWDDWSSYIAYDWGYMDTIVDIGDIDLIMFDSVDDALIDDSLSYLDESDFAFDGDIAELTEDLDYGWDDTSTDTGAELLESIEDNFDNSAIYDLMEQPVETFEDYGVEDFGDMGGEMDFGGADFGDFDFY